MSAFGGKADVNHYASEGPFIAISGRENRGNAVRILPMYRAYAHSALIENFPFVLVESTAYGLPMLANPVGGVPEVFFDGEQGFYWPLNDPTEGARKLIGLLEDKAIYTRLAEGARKRFEANYTAELVGPQLMNFFLEIAR